MSLRLVLLVIFTVMVFLSAMLTSAYTTPTGQVSSGCFDKVWYENNTDSCPDIPSDPKHVYSRNESESRELIMQYCLICPFNCKGGEELPSIDEHGMTLYFHTVHT